MESSAKRICTAVIETAKKVVKKVSVEGNIGKFCVAVASRDKVGSPCTVMIMITCMPRYMYSRGLEDTTPAAHDSAIQRNWIGTRQGTNLSVPIPFLSK